MGGGGVRVIVWGWGVHTDLTIWASYAVQVILTSVLRTPSKLLCVMFTSSRSGGHKVDSSLVKRFYVILCYFMLCYAMLCYVMLFYGMLCYVM